MLNKTNTLKSSQSTSVTSFKTSADTVKSPEFRRKVKERDEYIPSMYNDQDKNRKLNINPEIVLIRKEKVIDKHIISKSEDDLRGRNKKLSPNSKRMSISSIDKKGSRINLQNYNKLELKLYDDNNLNGIIPNETVIIKPILKKSSFLRKETEDVIPPQEVKKKLNVKFVDEDNFSLDDSNEKNNTIKQPLAEILMVESYRNYKIYAGSDNFKNYINEDKDDKISCRCHCVIF